MKEVAPRLHQAVLVAMITVGPDAETVLATFEREWARAADGQRTTGEIARMRMDAVAQAQAVLLTAAKRELQSRWS
jgi:hypothetical protein